MEYVEVLIAALAAFMLGFLWYSALFGKIWQAETGITAEQAQSGMGITHGTSFLMMLIIAYFTHFFWGNHMHGGTIGHGVFHSVMTAVMYAVPLMIINYLYQKKSLKLMLIDGGYAIAFFAVIGAVFVILPLYETPPMTLEEAKQTLESAQEYLKASQEAVDKLMAK